MDLSVIDALQKRFGSANFSRYQIIRQPKYDLVRYQTAGTTQIVFMTVPIGGTDPVGNNSKTFEQTNLVKSGSFGQEFYVLTQIRCYVNLLPKNRQASATISGDASAVWHGFTAADTNYFEQYRNLLDQGVLNITFGQKLYYQIKSPFQYAPPGFGVEIDQLGSNVLAADATKKRFWITQDNDSANVFNLSPIQIIEPELQIAATIDFPAGTSPVFTNTYTSSGAVTATPTMECGLIFDGYVIRPQQ